MNNPFILITDYKISTIHELVPILEKVMRTSRSLLIIADDFDNEVIATLVLNRLKGAVMTVGIRTPGFGDQAKELLEREPIDCQPEIWLNPEKTNFYDFTPDDIKIKGYPRDEIKSKNPQMKFDLGI